MSLRSLHVVFLALALCGCATFAPNVDGMYAAQPSAARSSAPPALVLIGDVGLPRGDDTVRLAQRVAKELRGAPSAPVIVLGDVFYVFGLLGGCPDYGGASMPACDDRSAPIDQLTGVLGPYREALGPNPLIGIGGNHDYYGGEVAVKNTCELVPDAGPGWAYYARGCELDDTKPVQVIDLGSVVVFAVDSEPMIRDRGFLMRTIEVLRGEIQRFRTERPEAWRLVATHHPLETHGSHNGATKLTGVLKDTYWLRKTALFPFQLLIEYFLGQQDPFELRYRAYRRALYGLFREEPIDAFVSGHDHSLQHVRIDHPGVRTQIVSGAGANRSPVQRFGQDFLWLNRLSRLVGLRNVVPAHRHWLEFGLGGELGDAEDGEHGDLSGYGFSVLRPDAGDLVVDYIDPAREAPVYTARIAR